LLLTQSIRIFHPVAPLADRLAVAFAFTLADPDVAAAVKSAELRALDARFTALSGTSRRAASPAGRSDKVGSPKRGLPNPSPNPNTPPRSPARNATNPLLADWYATLLQRAPALAGKTLPCYYWASGHSMCAGKAACAKTQKKGPHSWEPDALAHKQKILDWLKEDPLGRF
jgi:hypothetical protein